MLRNYALASESDTEALARQVAGLLFPGAVVYLYGDLGAGKTRFTRAVLNALGHEGIVKSPTYTLVEPYRIKGTYFYHFDLYRLIDPMELDLMGIQDYFDGQAMAFIEWPDKGQGFLPRADVVVRLDFNGDGRIVELESQSELGKALLLKLKLNL